jgi:phenylacetate-coenzyme A ligase PaaK-like adenylate-forming protein
MPTFISHEAYAWGLKMMTARSASTPSSTSTGETIAACRSSAGRQWRKRGTSVPTRTTSQRRSPLPESGSLSGELVATNLGRWGSPLIRYRTGDRVQVTREPCACGSPFARMLGGIVGRVDDMFTVRGVNLFPAQVEDLVRRHPSIGEFLIEISLVRGMEEAAVLCECQGEDAKAVVSRLAQDLRLALGARIECRAVPPGTLPRSELKSRRLRRV